MNTEELSNLKDELEILQKKLDNRLISIDNWQRLNFLKQQLEELGETQ